MPQAPAACPHLVAQFAAALDLIPHQVTRGNVLQPKVVGCSEGQTVMQGISTGNDGKDGWEQALCWGTARVSCHHFKPWAAACSPTRVE